MDNSNAETHNISGVIFDLDGTLLNTEQLTKNILKEFLAKYGKVQDSEKEKKRLGLTFKESAAAIVKDYGLPLTPEEYGQEITPMYHGKWLKAKPLPGADRLMRHLHKHGVPFALASNSIRRNIDAKISYHEGWKERFTAILGSDMVKSGKPSPDMFLEAAKQMGVDPSRCLVIEDSVVGVKAGKAAGMKVVAVPSEQVDTGSYSVADSVLHSILEFQPDKWGLPHFEDWIGYTLPIEPIHIVGSFSNGILQPCADTSLSFLPDQIWGLYVGWAKFDGQNTVNAVASIGWHLGCCGSKRKIQAHILGGCEDNRYNNMQLLLVGYLRRSCSTGYILKNLDITDEDILTADTALNLPAFSQKCFLLEHVDKDNFYE